MTSSNTQTDDDMAALRASVDKLTDDVAALTQSLSKVLKSRVGKAADDLRDTAQTTADDIKEKAVDSKDALESTIRERPLQSLLAAFGLGLLIAQLVRRQGAAQRVS